MGNKIFGVDVAKIVGKATKGKLLPATLHSIVTGARGGDVTAGPTQTVTDYACEGIIENYSDYAIANDLARKGDMRILLIGNSINSGATVPKVSDKVTIEGEKYLVVDVERDPAAASYVLQGRSDA